MSYTHVTVTSTIVYRRLSHQRMSHGRHWFYRQSTKEKDVDLNINIQSYILIISTSIEVMNNIIHSLYCMLFHFHVYYYRPSAIFQKHKVNKLHNNHSWIHSKILVIAVRSTSSISCDITFYGSI